MGHAGHTTSGILLRLGLVAGRGFAGGAHVGDGCGVSGGRSSVRGRFVLFVRVGGWLLAGTQQLADQSVLFCARDDEMNDVRRIKKTQFDGIK